MSSLIVDSFASTKWETQETEHHFAEALHILRESGSRSAWCKLRRPYVERIEYWQRQIPFELSPNITQQSSICLRSRSKCNCNAVCNAKIVINLSVDNTQWHATGWSLKLDLKVCSVRPSSLARSECYLDRHFTYRPHFLHQSLNATLVMDFEIIPTQTEPGFAPATQLEIPITEYHCHAVLVLVKIKITGLKDNWPDSVTSESIAAARVDILCAVRIRASLARSRV